MIYKISQMYAFMFLHRFISFYTVYLSILKKDNVSPFVISLIIITHEISKIISDVYSGVVADKYGIRKIMGIGLIIKAGGIIFWIINDNLVYYFIGIFLLGMGRSFTVGKIEAYTYNMLFSFNKQDYFSKIWLGMFLLDGLSAAIISWLSGTFYLIGGFKLVLLFSLFIILIIHVPLVFFVMKDPEESPRKLFHDISLFQMIKNGISFIVKNKNIALLVVTVGLLPSLFICLGKFKIFICNDINIPFSQIAKIEAGTHLLQVISAFLIIYFLKIQPKFKNNILLTGFILFIIGGSAYFYGIYSIIAIMIFLVIYPIIITSLKNDLESSIDISIRATISTTASFMMSFFNIVFMLLTGIITKFYSYQVALMALSTLSLIIIFITFFVARKK